MMTRALPDFGSCSAISRGMDSTGSGVSSVVNSRGFILLILLRSSKAGQTDGHRALMAAADKLTAFSVHRCVDYAGMSVAQKLHLTGADRRGILMFPNPTG